ncbi:MAG: hypothetical protein U9R72_06830 [Chloroflexota bacterium]|nr:hypothetical protein [Chloroflexota bacterium]
MELREAYSIIRRGAWPILLVTLFSVGVALVLTARTVPLYRASAMLLVHAGSPGDQGLYHCVLAAQRFAQTYAHMLTGGPIVDDVVRRLGLPDRADELAASITAEWVADTPLIEVHVDHPHPRTAARVANALAGSLSAYVDALQEDDRARSLAALRNHIDGLARRVEGLEPNPDGLEPLSETRSAAEAGRSDVIVAAPGDTYQVTGAELVQTAPHVILFHPAQAPGTLIRPRIVTTVGLAALVGCMVGLGAAFLGYQLDDCLRTPDDVQQATGLETLAAVPGCGAGWDLSAVEKRASPLLESVQRLWVNLASLGAGGSLRTVLVTSPVAVDGRSCIAACLAAVAARAGLRVVLVGADLGGSPWSGVAGWLSETGSMAATQDGPWEGTVHETAVEGLRCLATVESSADRARLGASWHLGELLDDLLVEADLVVVDGPPVLAAAEGVVLAQQVDGVVLVVDVRWTRRLAAREAVKSLRLAGAHVVGAVLNTAATTGGGRNWSRRQCLCWRR